MKNFKKVATGITAATVMMSMMTFTSCSKMSSKVITEEKDFDESFSNIEIDTTMENVKLLVSEDDETHVKFAHSESLKTTIEVKNDTLIVSEKGNFTLGGFSFSDDIVYLEIYLAEDSFDKLDIDVASADIYAVEGIDFDVIDIDTASGDVHLQDMEAGSVKIDTASGNVGIANVIADSFDIDTASGDVNFDMSDADDIKVNTASGDVKGVFLTEKKFKVNTASGDVNTPRSGKGGVCEVDTASGDVDLDIA